MPAALALKESPFSVPLNEQDEFAAVAVKWRTEADEWLATLARVDCGEITKAQAASLMRAGESTVRNKMAAVRREGWRALIPNYGGNSALPAEFIDYWRNLLEDFKRQTDAAAFRELCRRWHAREPIDGYAGHPGWPNLPRGWGTDGRNLLRYRGTPLEVTAAREGLGRAIARHAPKILGTRVGLWHLSHVAADDVWFDMKTHLLTRRQLVRPLQIGWQDVLSACRFLYGTKPQIIKDNGARENLKESDMRFSLASFLFNFGISPRGTTLLVEHGTAAIRSRVRDILRRGLGDLIQIPDSGMTGKLQAILGMHEGRGGGNPRHKPWLESLHNYMHNEFSALPAQTGHDRQEPEFLFGLEKECEWLFRIASQLPPHVLQSLRFPSREYYTEFLPAMHAMHEVINRRTHHDLEGWAKCGFLTTDYRLHAGSNEWVSRAQFLTLPAPVQMALKAAADCDERCMLPRKLSPREVFDLGHHTEGAVMKVPQGIIAEILYEDLAQPRQVRGGYIVIQDQEIEPEPMHFEARIMRADGREEELRAGETYDVVVNPFDPRFLWVFSALRNKGAFLGLAKRVLRVNRADVPGTEIALGRQMQRMADLTGDQKRRHATASNGFSRRALARVKHNNDVIEAARQEQADTTRAAAAALMASLPEDETFA